MGVGERSEISNLLRRDLSDIRCFDDENVIHVDGKVEPLSDLETINLELIFADIEVLDKRLLKLEKLIRSGDVQAQKDQTIIHSLKNMMESGALPNLDSFDNEEKEEEPSEIEILDAENKSTEHLFDSDYFQGDPEESDESDESNEIEENGVLCGEDGERIPVEAATPSARYFAASFAVSKVPCAARTMMPIKTNAGAT